MRVVANTNTVLSGLLWQGPPSRLLSLANASSHSVRHAFSAHHPVDHRPAGLTGAEAVPEVLGGGDHRRRCSILVERTEAVQVHAMFREDHPARLGEHGHRRLQTLDDSVGDAGHAQRRFSRFRLADRSLPTPAVRTQPASVRPHRWQSRPDPTNAPADAGTGTAFAAATHATAWVGNSLSDGTIS